MARLGIPNSISAMEPMVQPKASKPRTLKPANAKIEFAPENIRRSGRVVGKAPDYTGEFIDRMGDDDMKPRKRPRTESTNEEKEQELRELLDNSRRWLQESRDVLLK
eukprot:9471875-Pyramimonas_sp.AAC.1